MKQKADNRFMSLEGVRALAAIVVVFFHALYMFYPHAVIGAASVQHARFEDNLFGNPVFALISGGLAVAIFFVLSGFVLSIGFFSRGDEASVKNQAIRRYLRLMIPSIAAILLAFILLKFRLGTNASVAAVTGSVWLGEQWNFVPNISNALYEGFIGIFAQSGSVYDPVLWTMYYEFLGSLLIFGFLMLFGKEKKRWIMYALLLIITFKTFYLGFVVGMLLADLYANRKLPTLSIAGGSSVLILGLCLGGVSAIIGGNHLYAWISILRLSDTESVILLRTLGATAIIFAVLLTPQIAKLMEHKWISGIGKYTFALYLTHKLILFTVTGAIFLFLIEHMGYNRAIAFAFLGSVPFFVLATIAFERYVDRPAIMLAKQFNQWFIAGGVSVPGTSKRLASVYLAIFKQQILASKIYTSNLRKLFLVRKATDVPEEI